MNRKLQHSMLALSTTAAVFTLLLLAGGPAPAPRPLPATALAAGDETMLVAVSTLADGESAPSQRRHLRHSRALLALPYFSFAQGLRRNRS
jgi:hypothetical protein